MSQVYLTEPPTSGRIVFDTTHGPIDVNLWCTECPSTTRAFLQLCIDGYFNGMLFHRILNDFLIQTGLTRVNTTRPDINAIMTEETAMEKYMKQHITHEHCAGNRQSFKALQSDVNWLQRKKLEVCPRIKFNHRGQVALAIPLDSPTAGNNAVIDSETLMTCQLMRQFFITLSEASFLNHKHVIFGTVSGPTIFNAIRIGKTEVDTDGTAVDFENVPKIISVKIDFHPFTDLVATEEGQVPWKRNLTNQHTSLSKSELDAKQRRKQRKGKKDVNVLSFGDEMQDDPSWERDPDVRVQSIYDVAVQSTKKLKTNAIEKDNKDTSSDNAMHSYSDHLHQDPKDSKELSLETTPFNNYLPSLNAVIKQAPTQQQQQNVTKNQPQTTHSESLSIIPPYHDNKDTSTTKSSAIEARRAKYLSHRQGNLQNTSTREETTLSKLKAFKTKISLLKHESMIQDKNSNTSDVTQTMRDDSLAAQMAYRLSKQQQQQEEDNNDAPRMSQSKKPLSTTDCKHNNDSNGNNNNNNTTSSWMKTHFQCKRHIDTDVMMTMGGDGRSMDEYEVIDDKVGQAHLYKKGKRPHRH